MARKLLVTGGSGLLGSNIAQMAQKKYEVYATYFKHSVKMDNVHFFQVDLTRREEYKKIIEINPDSIIHCAALTDVDFAEQNPDEAFLLNVIATKNISKVARDLGAYLIFISTDSVFDGIKGNYSEKDQTNPINVYGETKLRAEKDIETVQENHMIVRTNIYGWNKRDKYSLAEWMINKLSNAEILPAFRDVFFSPILVNDLANVLFKLEEKNYRGLLNIAGGERCSKLEFAYKIAEIFYLDSSLIEDVSIEEFHLTAKRGKDLSLNVTRAENFLNERLPSSAEGLLKMKQLRDNNYLSELKSDTT
jgi:dTDP-4-dehydrorhamnose reductase